MPFRRLMQTLMFSLFLGLLLFTAAPFVSTVPVDAFVRMDPLLWLGAMLSLKTWVAGFGAAVVLLCATLLLGRFFCSHICPLGTTQDLVRPLWGGKANRHSFHPKRWRRWKYLILIGLTGAALYGLNLTHWGSPTALAARFYGLVVLPLVDFAAGPLKTSARSILERSGSPLAFAGQKEALVGGLAILVLLFLTVLVLTRVSPRFWCRCLCPTGAVLALVGRRPLIARTVSSDCTSCGLCAAGCPMGAIPSDRPDTVSRGECIACRRCEQVCPEGAIRFAAEGWPRAAEKSASPSRRGVLLALGSGLVLAFAGRRGLGEYWPASERGHVMPEGLVRPPGSVPEIDFLNRCVRCGLCMKACPTNMLQPAWLENGLSGMFSPLAVARRGPCEPECNACGQVCPTRAILPLPPGEKAWAKMGTAVIDRSTCLAWEYGRACLICDESCPYDAIRLVREEGVEPAVPVVDEFKCAGCGYCENHCPVQAEAAIRVTPMAALRLGPGEGPFQARGREMGLDIRRNRSAGPPPSPAPVSEDESQGLPPGFSP
ncbi:MAG: 4Fe-4S binding protein [Desulfohalobiaceae bacterium]